MDILEESTKILRSEPNMAKILDERILELQDAQGFWFYITGNNVTCFIT